MIDRRRGGPFDGRRLRQILITHLLVRLEAAARENHAVLGLIAQRLAVVFDDDADDAAVLFDQRFHRSEEHTSELQSLMRISYAGFCLKKKNITNNDYTILISPINT